MSALQAVVDRFEIEALRAEVTDAVMMRDFDRVASLFTPDGAMRWPHIDKEFADEAGLPELLAGAARRGFDLAAEPPLRAELFA
ncbi:hypothetical protein ACWCQQ_50645, partial [Streptomyces sp. NPDC002143]